jgi:putative YhbY family RNA-binding protein
MTVSSTARERGAPALTPRERSAPALTPRERSALRASAHRLDPVVMIGDGGLTPAVLQEVDRSLEAHELIKIRVSGDDRDARDGILRRICEELDAAPVQHIGKILVVYRQKSEKAAKPKARPRRKPARQLKRTFQNRA